MTQGVVVPAFLGPLIAVEDRGPDTNFIELQERDAADAAGQVLRIAVQPQLLRFWCWAAVTASVQDWYREPYAKQQCAVAGDWLGLPCCPPGPDDPTNPRNREYNLTTALNRNAAANPIGGPILPQQVAQAINANQPIVCAVQWRSTGKFHAVVLVGYYAATGEVVIRDPLTGEHQLPYDQFRTAYGGDGEWKGTLLTRRHG